MTDDIDPRVTKALLDQHIAHQQGVNKELRDEIRSARREFADEMTKQLGPVRDDLHNIWKAISDGRSARLQVLTWAVIGLLGICGSLVAYIWIAGVRS